MGFKGKIFPFSPSNEHATPSKKMQPQIIFFFLICHSRALKSHTRAGASAEFEEMSFENAIFKDNFAENLKK